MKKSLLVLLAVVFVTAASSLNARCCETKCEKPKACCEKVCKPCKTECKADLNCKPCEVFFSGNHCNDEGPNCTGGTCTNIRNKSEGTYNSGKSRATRFDAKRMEEARRR